MQDSTKYIYIAIAFLIGIAIFSVMHPHTTFAADGKDVAWDSAVQRSQEAGQPTIILFSAGWCGACQALHHEVLSRADVHHELMSHYSFYQVDLTNPTPAERAHAQKFGVYAIPCMIRFDKDGHETDRKNYMDPDEMIAWLKAGE